MIQEAYGNILLHPERIHVYPEVLQFLAMYGDRFDLLLMNAKIATMKAVINRFKRDRDGKCDEEYHLLAASSKRAKTISNRTVSANVGVSANVESDANANPQTSAMPSWKEPDPSFSPPRDKIVSPVPSSVATSRSTSFTTSDSGYTVPSFSTDNTTTKE